MPSRANSRTVRSLDLPAKSDAHAVSVPSNIAEGRGRLTDKSFAVFLSHARGSLYELQTQIELACNLGFADLRDASPVLAEAAQISAMIHALLATLRPDGERELSRL